MEAILKATHEGNLNINGFDISAYNLPNGERVLSRIGFLKAIGRTGKAKGGRQYDDEFQIPVFLTANNLKSLLDPQIIENSKPIPFYDLNGNQSIGYKAELLPQVAFLFSDALSRGLLKSNQIHVGEQSRILVKGFLNVSIIALVDEATGYQYDREKHELQVILKTFISDEILEYQQQFQLSFYREIFRLWNIPFTEQNIKRKPQFIGHITNRYVYSNMPKGSFVLEQLKARTPKNEKGKYKIQFHRSLTEIGKEALKKVLYSVEALASISENKRQFEKVMQNKYGQKEIPFTDLETLDDVPIIKELPKLSDFNEKLAKGLEFDPNAEK